MRYFVFKNTNICHRFLICCGIASLAILFVSSHAFADVTYSDTDPENPIPTGAIVIGDGGVGNVTFIINDTENASSVAGISGTGTITKTGAGTLVYSVATTYTGDTVINGGTLRLDGAAGGGKLFNGTITIAAGASMVCNKHDTLGYNASPANTFNIYGTLDNAVQNESLRNTVFNMYGGTISCTSGGTLDVLADTVKFRAHALDGATAEAPTVSTISGKINFRVTGEIEFGADANSVLQLKDVVTGGGTPDFLKTGAGTVEFTKLPNYPGTTTVREGTLKISVSPGNSKFFKGEVTINAGRLCSAAFTTRSAIIMVPRTPSTSTAHWTMPPGTNRSEIPCSTCTARRSLRPAAVTLTFCKITSSSGLTPWKARRPRTPPFQRFLPNSACV